MGFWCVFCVHDIKATRGQHLALSKAWGSCLLCVPILSLKGQGQGYGCAVQYYIARWTAAYYVVTKPT